MREFQGEDSAIFDLPLEEYLQLQDEVYSKFVDIPAHNFEFIGSTDDFASDFERLFRDVLGRRQTLLERNRNPDGSNYENEELRAVYESANAGAIEIYRAMMAEREKQLA